jgi:tetratricopeptide (TPR) repeat protein
LASVFLSYDRDDTDRARPLVALLEKAGHSVWWDLHVRGGAQFSKVIEEALKAADVVVVLWSANSIESAWVRDEAAAGRDTNRLVPATIDGTEAPLGFRQFQTIDLSGWRGRGKPDGLQALIADVEAVAADRPEGRPSPAPPPKARSAAHPGIVPIRTWIFAGALVAGLLLLILGLVVARPWERKSAAALTVSVAAADPSAAPLAHDLLVSMGDLRSVQKGFVRLLGDPGNDPPDLTFEASTAGTDKRGANLVLMRGKDRSILWSREFGQEAATPADLKQQIAYTAARVLACVAEGLEPGTKPIPAQTLKLYLTACSQYAVAGEDDLAAVSLMFRQVVKEAPGFKPGWAKLLVVETAGDLYYQNARDTLRQDVARAQRLDPAMPEVVTAQVALLPRGAYGETLRLLDEAHESSPENATILVYRTQTLLRVGRLNDAIADAKQAVELDPTSPHIFGNYILALAYSGRTEAAQEQLRRAERTWPGTGRVRDLDYAFLLRFGDPKDLLKSDAFKQAPPLWQTYVRTRVDPTPANVDRFMALLRDLYSRRGLHADDISGHSQAYAELNREDDLYRLIAQVPPQEDLSLLSDVLFRPALRKFREDPRFMIVAKRVGLVDYWTKSGKWPDFCFLDPEQPYDCKAEAAKLS